MGKKSRKEIEDLYGSDAPDDIEYWDEMDRKAREELGWDDDDDEMPSCCQSCGGRDNYPDCTDSCSIFDD